MKLQNCYHSTAARNVPGILRGGFALDASETGFGSAKGRGVYCAQRLEGAAFWYAATVGEALCLQVKVREGARLLWVEPQIDRRCIDQLRREFGKDILRSPHQFFKSRPSNKQFTKNEIIALVGYFFHARNKHCSLHRRRLDPRLTQQWWRSNFAHLKRELQRHGYDGIGDRSEREWDSDEIVLFNPSDLQVVSVHRLHLHGDPFDEPPPQQGPTLLPALSAEQIAEVVEADRKFWQRLMKDE